MDPKQATSDALGLAAIGDLEQAAELLNNVCAEYREFGPGYTAHALVFLMAGDTAQAITDLDAADWANKEYGLPDQLRQSQEIRLLAHAVRTIYGGQKESEACRTLCDELRQNTMPVTTWLLPAICYDFEYRLDDAKKSIASLARHTELKPALDQFFQKHQGWTGFLTKHPDMRGLAPVHFARHLRAKRDGDVSGAAKHLKRLRDVTSPLEAWAVMARFAAGEATVETA